MPQSIRACVFDAYGTLLDVHSAVMRHAAVVGKDAGALSALWRQRQLEYSWTRSLMGCYADFWQITEEALVFSLQSFGLDGRADGLKDQLMQAYLELSAYEDAVRALEQLKTAGMQVAVLSNGTPRMLQQAMDASGLSPHIDTCISVDEVKIYKPDPQVYQLACNHLQVTPDQVCFVSSNAWDLAGATTFGFRTVQINRNNVTAEYSFAIRYGQQSSLSAFATWLCHESVQ